MTSRTTCWSLIALSLISVLAEGGAAARRQTGPPAGQTDVLRATGAFFALSVADAKATAAWYSDKLGLKVVMQPPRSNEASVIVLEGGGLIVELIQHDKARPLARLDPAVSNNILVHGIFKAGIIVDDFDKTIAALRERRVPFAFGPFPAGGGQRPNAAVRDNEGNLIQFFGK